jgi:uncharacterized protein (UPF0210 family)
MHQPSSENHEIYETLRMIEAENLDIRTVTLGLSLMDLAGSDAGLPDRIYQRVVSMGHSLVQTARDVEADLGVPIINKRVAVTPVALLTAGGSRELMLQAALALDHAAAQIGIDYIGGFSALVQKGITAGDHVLIDVLPEALGSTTRLCGCVNVASTRAGINMDAVHAMGQVVHDLAHATAEQAGVGCARFVVFANAVEDNPFVAGAFHGIGEPQAVINVGVSGPGVVRAAVVRLMQDPKFRDAQGRGPHFGIISDTIKRMAFKISRAGELVGRMVADRLGAAVRFGVVDLSLAPTPAKGDSVADIIEAMGVERFGAPGTTAALMLLTDAVKKGGAMASAYVGGLSGAFIPVSEDAGMVEAVRCGALSLEKLEALTAVCSVGLDMVAVPGDTPPATLAAIIADEMTIGVINNKTTAARLLPVPGKKPGDIVAYGGLLGNAIVMPVNAYGSAKFLNLGGRIPAPIHSLRN